MIRLADRLRQTVKESVPEAVVGRLDGDEFAAVLPKVSEAAATDIASRLTERLKDDIEVGRRIVRISASIGLAMANPRVKFQSILAAADQAMYVLKERSAATRHRSGSAKVIA